MTFTAEQIANPTQAVIDEFLIPEEHHDLMRRWGEMIHGTFRGAVPAYSVRTDQTTAHPFAIELIGAFGTATFRYRDALIKYHRASFEAALIRKGIG